MIEVQPSGKKKDTRNSPWRGPTEAIRNGAARFTHWLFPKMTANQFTALMTVAELAAVVRAVDIHTHPSSRPWWEDSAEVAVETGGPQAGDGVDGPLSRLIEAEKAGLKNNDHTNGHSINQEVLNDTRRLKVPRLPENISYSKKQETPDEIDGPFAFLEKVKGSDMDATGDRIQELGLGLGRMFIACSRPGWWWRLGEVLAATATITNPLRSWAKYEAEKYGKEVEETRIGKYGSELFGNRPGAAVLGTAGISVPIIQPVTDAVLTISNLATVKHRLEVAWGDDKDVVLSEEKIKEAGEMQGVSTKVVIAGGLVTGVAALAFGLYKRSRTSH